MAGRAVVEPEVLVEVEEAIGKRQGRLRRGGGGLQPVAPASLRDRAAGRGKRWWRLPSFLWGSRRLGGGSLLRLCFATVGVCQDECLSVRTAVGHRPGSWGGGTLL